MAQYRSEGSPSLILGMLAIEIARRGRGHVDIDLRDGGSISTESSESPLPFLIIFLAYTSAPLW